MGENDFKENILVSCPRCDVVAYVTGGTRLSCPSCGLQKSRSHARKFGTNGIGFEHKENLDDWYGLLSPVIKGNASCHTCGNRVETGLKPQARQKIFSLIETMDGHCTTCKRGQAVEILWVPYAQTSAPIENGFGTHLHLVEDTAKGTLFAFNADHAQLLLEYVSSGQRGKVSENYTAMFAMLPSWVKSAKNRRLVEKTLKRFITKAT